MDAKCNSRELDTCQSRTTEDKDPTEKTKITSLFSNQNRTKRSALFPCIQRIPWLKSRSVIASVLVSLCLGGTLGPMRTEGRLKFFEQLHHKNGVVVPDRRRWKNIAWKSIPLQWVCRLRKRCSDSKNFWSFVKSTSIRLARTKANDLGGPRRLLRMAVSQFWGGRDLCLSSFWILWLVVCSLEYG